jgi:hypothetical protein
MRQEARDLKEVVAEQTLALRLLKKNMLGPPRQIALQSPAGQRMGPTTNEVSLIPQLLLAATISPIREVRDHPAGRGKPPIGPPDAGQTRHSAHHILSLV